MYGEVTRKNESYLDIKSHIIIITTYNKIITLCFSSANKYVVPLAVHVLLQTNDAKPSYVILVHA